MCGKSCKQSRSGESHYIQGSKRQTRCKVFSECFNSKAIMNPHLLDNHGFNCAICEDTVADKPQLKVHMQSTTTWSKYRSIPMSKVHK